eukprot:365018-Chlamydomonas_euryale.AAC.7
MPAKKGRGWNVGVDICGDRPTGTTRRLGRPTFWASTHPQRDAHHEGEGMRPRRGHLRRQGGGRETKIKWNLDGTPAGKERKTALRRWTGTGHGLLRNLSYRCAPTSHDHQTI